MIRPTVPSDAPRLVELTAATGLFRPDEVETLRDIFDAYFTDPLSFLPGLNDQRYLEPIGRMEKKVIASGEGDPNVDDSRRVAGVLNDKGLGVWFDLVPGWAHDWPYWGEMVRRYV